MQPKVSEKNTKSQILNAYDDLLKKVQEMGKEDRQAQKVAKDEKATVEKAGKSTSDQIIADLANLKLQIVRSFDSLEDSLINEYKKLKTLQEAISIEARNLDEVHQIKINADSLTALLLGHKEKKVEFEAYMLAEKEEFEREKAEKEADWKKKLVYIEQNFKEEKESLAKERKRDEEEYAYRLAHDRTKEKDSYEQKQALLEKELNEKRQALEVEFAEREKVLSDQELELKELREKVNAFPEILKREVSQSEKQVVREIELKHKYESQLREGEVAGEKKLGLQMIAALEAEIKEKERQIDHLTQKTGQASAQVQDIALKAIEGASLSRNLGNMLSRQLEQEKSHKTN